MNLQKLKTPAFLLLTYCALLTGARSVQYITTDGDVFHPHFREKYMANLPVIWTHGIAAIAALVIGPAQFIPAIRRRWPRAHRISGRVYLVGILIGGLSGFYMGAIAFGGFISQFGFCMLAVLWLYTGWLALATVLRRDFASHRAWMIRNYALTFAAVMLRIELSLWQMAGLEFETIYPYIAWISMLPNLAIAELIINPKLISDWRNPKTTSASSN